MSDKAHALVVSAATSGGADYTGAVVTVGGIILVALAGSVFAWIFRRTGEGARASDLWKRVDELTAVVYGDDDSPGLIREMADVKRQAAAQGRVISAIARQAPEGFIPRLDPNDLDEIDETTMPADHPWRSRSPTAPIIRATP